MRKPLKLFISLLCATTLVGCNNSPKEEPKKEEISYKYGEDEMYEKIWESKVIHNESVVLIEGDDGRFSGQLLYTPKRIISVRDNTLSKEYGKDEYYVEGDRLNLSDTGTMRHLTKKNIDCEEVPNLIGGTYDGRDGGKILFTEGVGILCYQIMVTYEHDDTWLGAIPEKKGDKLPKLQQKLKNKDEILMVTNGDSIFCGCNSSGLKGVEPFQDPFPTAFASEMSRVYGATVNNINTSVGGMLSDWGWANVQANVNNYTPDLVVIGFGMNDGSWKINVDDYIEHIELMVKSIQNNCPDVSIIVCATILPSVVSPQANGNHEDYLQPLLELEKTYSDLAVLDMTTFSKDLFVKKNSLSLFANNINHPADWLSRLYTVNLMNLIEEK